MPKDPRDWMIYRDERAQAILADVPDTMLDALQNEIYLRRLDWRARGLRAKGFSVKTEHRGEYFRYLCVYPPEGVDAPGEWADLEEAGRLLDTVFNLPPAEAFVRWAARIEKPIDPGYTRADAVRDTQEARAELREKAARTNMTAEDYALEYADTDFMDLAPPPEGGHEWNHSPAS